MVFLPTKAVSPPCYRRCRRPSRCRCRGRRCEVLPAVGLVAEPGFRVRGLGSGGRSAGDLGGDDGIGLVGGRDGLPLPPASEALKVMEITPVADRYLSPVGLVVIASAATLSAASSAAAFWSIALPSGPTNTAALFFTMPLAKSREGGDLGRRRSRRRTLVNFTGTVSFLATWNPLHRRSLRFVTWRSAAGRPEPIPRDQGCRAPADVVGDGHGSEIAEADVGLLTATRKPIRCWMPENICPLMMTDPSWL